MQPDSEREHEWRKRATDLFDCAPAPDAARLEAVLASVHAGHRRSLRRRRMVWSVAAVALGGIAAASAAWWLTPQRLDPAGEPRSEPSTGVGEPEAERRESGERDERETGTGNDGPVIYRRMR